MSQGDTSPKAPPRAVDVLIPVAVDRPYSYRVPPGLTLAPGDSVIAPLGTRKAYGVVWDAPEAAPGEARQGDNLKSVIERLDRPPLAQPLRAFLDWLAAWTLAPRGMALRLATRAAEDAEPEAPRLLYAPSGRAPERPTPARQRVLAAAALGPQAKKALAEAAACSSGVVDALIAEGALAPIAAPPPPLAPRLDPLFAPPRLEPAQTLAAQALTEALASRAFKPFLLEGVTGAGKTEVYLEAVAAALREGGQSLVLLPEIALTAQFLDRFAARFGARPAEWHSAVSPRQRSRLWRAAAEGSVQTVVGARSALFLPFKDLRLIVVDEEHDGAYKQEEGVAYHARDMAVMRAKLEGAAIVLASATPSLETRLNAERGRYGHLRLAARIGGRPLPRLGVVDMRKEGPKRGRWIAPRLTLAMDESLARGEQTLLFLNRRGYAPLTLCRVCGRRFQCGDCDAWLVEHRFRRALLCHHCGHSEPRPSVCPDCGAAESLTACGPGVERVAEEAAALFPNARLLILSSDMPGGPERLRREMAQIEQGAVDIVIGTQLAAKGHNFPLLTLVGVVDADLGLDSGDPRAGERAFQLLAQVTGRAGRFERPGQALLQSYQPEHPVIRALLSGDAERFYAQETALRRRAGLPPFGRLAALVVSAKDGAAAEAHARALARAAQELPESARYRLAPPGAAAGEDEILLLGPAEAPLALLRGRHRYRLLAKAPKSADLQAFLRDLLAQAPKPRGDLRVAVDVEPMSFL